MDLSRYAAGGVVRATASEMEDGAEVSYSRIFIVRRIAFSGGEEDILVRSDGGKVLCPENREQVFTCESGAGGVGGAEVGGDVVNEFEREFVEVGWCGGRAVRLGSWCSECWRSL